MANRYWVGGTADWNGTAGTKWALTSGGAGGQAVPTSSDDVFFDAASGSITASIKTVNANCKSLTCTGFTGTIAFTDATNLSLHVSGNVTLSATTTLSSTFDSYLRMNASGTLTRNGATIQVDISVGGSSANSYSFADAIVLTKSSTGGNFFIENDATCTLNGDLTIGGYMALTQGTFTANGKNVTFPPLNGGAFISSNTNTRTLNMGTGTWTFQGVETIWDLATVTNLTLNASTSNILCNSTSNSDLTFSGGGKTYNNIRFTRGTSTGANIILGSNTFAEIRDNEGTAAHALTFEAGKTNTFTTFTVAGTAGALIVLSSSSAATHTLSKASGTVTVQYCNISYSIASGGATFNAGASLNSGNNTGWAFQFSFPVAVGVFVLTGSAAPLAKGKTMTASVGVFILSGVSASLRASSLIYTNETKNGATATNISKNSATFTNTSKNAASITNLSKSVA